MGCVTCSPAMEGIVNLTEQNGLSQEVWKRTMIGPNTLTGDPLVIIEEPFINYVSRSLNENSDRIFLLDAQDGKKYTFGDLHHRAKCWGHWLKSKGIGKGDVVSISSENDISGFSILLGTWLSGASANPINFNFTANDIKTMFQCTLPDVIYCSKNIDIVHQAVEKLEKKIPIVTPNGKYPDIDIEPILKSDPSDFEPFFVENTMTHIASIMFTSGTTGMPKGIQITDNTLKVFPRSAFLGYSPVMITSPMFWVSNLGGFSYSLYGCNQIIIPKKEWDLKDILYTIQTYKPLSWFTGHSLLLDLTQKPFLDDYDLSSLQCIITGGTLLLANQRREINEKVFKNRVFIRHIYGSTEVGIVTRWRDDIDLNSDEYNSVGTLEKGVTLKIMDTSGRQLGPREEGEIWVKSASMTPGYMTLNRSILNAIDEDGWYHMGDLGYYDEKKLIYVVGRLKDIMKFRGVQIAPAEIEQVLNEHPDVIESSVVGKFDVIDGDKPVAFVMLKNGSTVTVDELQQFCTDNLAEVKVPHEFHIIDSIPKSAVGKVLRAELEKMLT